jgi:hypothetical protein
MVVLLKVISVFKLHADLRDLLEEVADRLVVVDMRVLLLVLGVAAGFVRFEILLDFCLDVQRVTKPCLYLVKWLLERDGHNFGLL